ncbi:hypothetical protein Tco_0802077 [Tanacetum coccineum]|uniref:Retrotransposon protein, putative, unclassified n=1 Tax=Tanacetum coccineum TaxID=301880 RepID=A0ABQ4ZXT4_9ASTR
MVEKSKLDEDLQRNLVDATLYRGMIGSLMQKVHLPSRVPRLNNMALSGCWCIKPMECVQVIDYGFQFNKIPLYCDNKSAIALCCNNVQHSRAKHIDVGYHFIKEQVENGIVELYFVWNEYQLADIFTKPLPRERFNFLIEKLGELSTALKCNMRLKIDIKPKEATFQVVLDALALTPFYQAFLITAEVPAIYIQKFEDLTLEHDILSFIRDLGHSGDIIYLTDKHVQATKGTRLKTKAKVAKSDKKKQPAKMPKAKGLDVLSKVLDEQHLKTTGADEGTGTIPGVPDVPKYEFESEKESWGDSGEKDKDDENDSEDKSDGNDDDDANDDDNQEGDDTNDDAEETDSDSTESDIIKIPVLNQSSIEYYEEEEEKIDDEETMDEEEDDEVTKELYDDVNVNLGNKDTDMTDADQGALEQQNVSQESRFEQVEEDVHVTLTLVIDTQKNPSLADNEIASLMETSALHTMAVTEITSGFTTTIPPPPPFFNPLPQQATPTLTPTTSEATTSFPSFPSLLDFSSVFKFNDRVTNMEKDLLEIKLVHQYAQALSSIPTIVDCKPYSFDLSKPLLLIRDHRGHQVIPQDFFINNDLEYLKGGDLNRRYSTSVRKTKAATYEIKWIDLVLNLWSPVKDVYSTKRIIVVTRLLNMKKYDYGHLEEIEVRREDQKLYKFREGDFPRLRLQGIEDMRVEDLQLGVESYQKKLNLTMPDIFRSNLINRTTYTAYSDPKGVIYKDQMNRTRLMRADELHKFSDDTLDDVRSAINDIAKGIRMKYLPKRKWSGLDKQRDRVMV